MVCQLSKLNIVVIKSIGIYFSANLLNAFIPLMLMPILTRYLTVSEYGEVAVFIAVVGFCSALVGTTFVGSVGRKFFDENFSSKEYSGYVAAALTLGAIGTTLVLFLLFFFDIWLSQWLKIDVTYLYLGLLVAFWGFIIQIKLNQYQVRKEPTSFGKLQISWTALNATLSIIAVVLFNYGEQGRIYSQFIASIFMMVISLCLLNNARQLNFKYINKKYYRELLLFGLPLFPHVMGGYFLNSIDRVIIGNKIDLEAAGFYAVAFQLAAAAGLVFDALNKAFQPWLFEKLTNNKISDKLKIVKYTYYWFIILALVFFSFSFIAKDVLNIIAGDKYVFAGDIFVVLLWAQLFKGMYFAVVNYCFYMKQTGWLSLISILVGFLQVAMLFVFIENYGVTGAAYAYVLSMLFRFILTWLVAIKIYEMPWFSFNRL